MFSRRTPASFRGFARGGSRVPLVVRQTSSIPSTAAARRQMDRIFFLTKGSPPVIRSLLIPREAAASTALIISSSVSMSSWRFLHTPSAGMQ